MCYIVEKCVTIRLGDSMLPNKLIYKSKEFETIGFIKLNNGSFLILQNNEDIIYLDLSKINLKLDLRFEIKEATKVEIVLMDYIIEAIRNDIKNGKYQNKDDLKKDIVDLNKYINTHPELLDNMKQLDFKDDVVNKTMTSLLTYFDEIMSKSVLKEISLNVFKIEGTEYVRDEFGNFKLIDKNEKLIQQVAESTNQNVSNQETNLSVQPEVLNSTLSNGNLQTNPTVELNSINEYVNPVDTFNEPTNQNVSNQETNLSVQPEVLNTTLNNENLQTNPIVELNSINEYVNPVDEFVEPTNQNVSNQETNSSVQPEALNTTLNNEKPKVKTLSLNDNNGKAAFIDTLLLSFIVGLVSGMYLIILILIIMS